MLAQGRDLHIDAVLSNIMVGRRPVGGIVNDLVPIVNVNKQSNVYYKSNYKENLLYVPGMTDRARGAKSREVYWTVSSDTYFAKNYALGTKWFNEDNVNADDPVKLQRKAARFVTDRVQIDYEARVAGLCSSTSNVSTVFNAATPWSNTTGSRPFDDFMNNIEGFREATSLRPNVGIIPEQVMRYLRQSDQVRDLLFGDRGGVPVDAQIATLLKLDRILVPEIFINSAGVGETVAGSGEIHPVWSNQAWLAYVGDLEAGDEQDTWISAFRWTDPSFGVPFAIRAFDYKPETRSQKIEASYYQAEKVVSKDLGWIINSVV